MKDQSIAKLCAQCDEYYGEVLKLLQKDLILAALDKDWATQVSKTLMRNILFNILHLF